MKMRILFFLMILNAAVVAAAQEAPSGIPAEAVMRFQAQSAPTGEDEAYKAGTQARDEGRWQDALAAFDKVGRMNGRRADAALYWKAYSLNKLGRRAESLAAIAALQNAYPRSTWLKDARVLEGEVRQASGQTVNPEKEEDEDLKLMALNSLMNDDEGRAIPLLEKFLKGTSSKKLKERALFVLAQNDSPKAQALMLQIAKGQTMPELQEKAIHNLAISGGSHKSLQEIYVSSSDVAVKKSVLHGMGISGGVQELLALARTEKSPELKKEAIHGLAISGGREELRTLYHEATDVESKREVLRSTVISGDTQLLMQVLQSEPNLELKRDAIHGLGISGGSEASKALMGVYNNEKDRELRKAAVEALFIHGDAHSLVELARKETDPEMRRALVNKLSVMGNREATDYLMEILNK